MDGTSVLMKKFVQIDDFFKFTIKLLVCTKYYFCTITTEYLHHSHKLNKKYIYKKTHLMCILFYYFVTFQEDLNAPLIHILSAEVDLNS